MTSKRLENKNLDSFMIFFPSFKVTITSIIRFSSQARNKMANF